MAATDFYRRLGVERTATADEIQRAYRKLAREWHPDINKAPEAEARFKELSEAYDVLSDPDLRARYDTFGENFRQVPDDVDPRAWAAAQAGRRPGPGSAGRRSSRAAGPTGDVFVDFGDLGGSGGATLEDLLGGMFTDPGQRWGAGVPRSGPDQEVEIELSVADAFRGGKHRISLQGSGEPRRYTVSIPAGVIDGQRIRLAGQGAPGRAGGAPGDLYLVVRLRPDARFRTDGRTIIADLPISPWEAALGATVPIDTPGGETKVRVPAGTSSGKTLRLRGKGMPNANGPAGDFHAVVKIVVPEELSARERELLVELAAESDFDPRRSR